MAKAQRIFQNILHYSAGQVGIAIFGLVGSAVLARYMTKPAFGQFSYLVAVAALLLPFLDGGATGYYARQSARQRNLAGEHWARAIAIRIYTSPFVAAVLAGYFYFTTGTVSGSAALVLLYALLQSLLLSTDVVFRSGERGQSWAIRRMVYESTYLIMTVVGILALGFTGPLQQFSIAVAGVFFGGSWAVFTVLRLTKLNWAGFLSEVKRPFTWPELKTLWPFAINSILFIFYYRLTAIFVERFASAAQLADFRVAFVVMTSALYLPKAIIWAVSPRVALHDETGNKEKFQNVLRQSAGANLLISTLVTVGGLLYGQRLIGIVFGAKYAHLGALWIVFDVTIGLFCIQQFCTDTLNNLHKEAHVARTIAVGVTLITILNIALIPKYGAFGAGIGRMVAGMVMVPINLREVIALVGGRNLHSFSLWRFLAVTGLVTAVAAALLEVNFWLSLAVFLVGYGASHYLAGTIPSSLDKLVLKSLQLIGVARR